MAIANYLMLDQHGRKGSLQKSRGGDGVLGHVVIKTMDPGLNPETPTHWLVMEGSLLPSVCLDFLL